MNEIKIYKVGCRWDSCGAAGTSILDVFQKNKILFIGDCDNVGNPEMGNVSEGDILIVADGYTVMGVAEAKSPSAAIKKFKVSTDPSMDDYLYDHVWGCMVDLYVFEEEDRFEYKKMGRICRVVKPDIIEKSLNLLNKYRALSSSNIFHWATSELSQDALLCWLFDGIKTNARHAPLALAVLQNLDFLKNKNIKVENIYRQYYNMDIVLELELDGKSHVLVVEDKINASLHNDIEGYRKSICSVGLPGSWHPDMDQVSACIIRTGDGNELITGIDGSGNKWPVIRRMDILEAMEKYKSLVDESDILKGFYAILKQNEEAYQNYADTSNLSWSAWKGFYDYLYRQGCVRNWFYVPNPSGGFLCALVNGLDNHPNYPYKDFCIYLQINSYSQSICLMVGEVYENQSAERNKLVELLHEFQEQNGSVDISWTKPLRYGCGTYMTFAVIPPEKWLNGTKEEATECVCKAQRWLHGFHLFLDSKG